MPPSAIARLRKICLALPEAHEVEAWSEPTFRVKNKMFAMFANNHHADGRIAVWCKSSADNQELLIQANPTRFFYPPYVGPSGWVGIVFDAKTDWKEVAEIITDGYRMVAPRKILALLDAR